MSEQSLADGGDELACDECCVCGDRDDLYRAAGKVYCHYHLAVSEGGDE